MRRKRERGTTREREGQEREREKERKVKRDREGQEREREGGGRKGRRGGRVMGGWKRGKLVQK